MRKVLYFYLSLISLCMAFSAPDNEGEKNTFYKEIEDYIKESSNDGILGLDGLAHSIRNLGEKVEFHPDQRWGKCYILAKNAIISIPGYSKVFRDKIEKNREIDENEYGKNRYYYIAEVFVHLPSPESVQILGEYLDDFRDSPTPDLPLDQQTICRPWKKGGHYVELQENAWLATYALSNLGLRDSPENGLRLFYSADSPKQTEAWKKFRAWYNEVKSGKKTFSFKGQAVEYRFKPDGTWDTIPIVNPPDDAIVYKFHQASKDQTGTPPATPLASQESHWKQPWAWGVGAFVLFLIGIFGWSRKIRGGHAV